MAKRPCITCGEPSVSTRCDDCAPSKPRSDHDLSAHQRGYDSTWQRLSKRARRLQPWCTDCRTTADLTADHSAEAWERKANGKVLRLQDIAVVCRSCNNRRGPARGEGARRTAEDRSGKAKSALQLGAVLSSGVPNGSAAAPERAEVVESLRDQGLSIRAIAAATGTGTQAVQADLKRGVVNHHTSAPAPDGGPLTLDERPDDEWRPIPDRVADTEPGHPG